MTLVRLARNAVIAKLLDPPRQVVTFVAGLLSYQVENTTGIGGAWSGKSSFYDVLNHTFPAGFTHLVQAELQKLGHTVHVIQRPRAEPLGPENPIVDEFGNDDPRYDFQLRALRQVEKHGEGIIQVATGGGKSKIAKLIMARYKRMSLFLTTRGILLYQMDDQLKAIGLNTGQLGDGELRPVRGINLGMVQTLVQALEVPDINVERRAIVKSIHLSKNKDENMPQAEIARLAQERFDAKTKRRAQVMKILEMIEVVIGEEAHEAGGSSYYEILRHCKNATIRVALTATPFMRESAADNMRLMAAFGPLLVQVPEALLIERGILARPSFKFVDAKPHEKLRKSSPYERALELGYITNPFMFEALVEDALKAKRFGLPVLTLVLRKKHGEAILAAVRARGIRAEFLRGENDQAERRAQLKRLANGEIDLLIGTTILDVGVDCPAIGLLQLAGGGKAEIALRQRIGRALRAKKFGPNVAFVADYSCNINSYLREHARQRRHIIETTDGFREGILPDGQDFAWDLFAPRQEAA